MSMKKVKCFDMSPDFIQETHNVFFANSCTHIVIYDGGGIIHVDFWTHITLELLAVYSLNFSTSFFYLILLVFWVMTLHGLVCGCLLISYRLHFPLALQICLLPCYCEITSMKRKLYAVAWRTKAGYWIVFMSLFYSEVLQIKVLYCPKLKGRFYSALTSLVEM
jgi:hypothetical protein